MQLFFSSFNVLVFLLEFLVFAFAGWIMDSSYSSFGSKKLVISGYFRGVPLCPIYGFGGIILLHTFATLSDFSPLVTILITTILVILVEYFGGVMSEHILGEKLWDYSHEKFNLQGHISLWHNFLWLVVVTLCYLILGRQAGDLVNWLNSNLSISYGANQALFLVVLVVGGAATYFQRSKRLQKSI